MPITIFKRDLDKWIGCLCLFSLASLASQYGSARPVDISWLFGAGWWLPLSAFTIIPFLDVMRSFTQHYAEQAEVPFKTSLRMMLIVPLTISLICTIIAGLPVTIFLAALAAVNLGGLVDILVFRVVNRISNKPYVRMMFSNLAATLIGSGLFFAIAFTNLVPALAGIVGIDFVNPLVQDNLVKGWFAQSMCIWVSSIVIGTALGKTLEYFGNVQQKRRNKTVSCGNKSKAKCPCVRG